MPVRRSLLFLQFSVGQLAFTGIDRDFVGFRPGQGSLPHRLFPVPVDSEANIRTATRVPKMKQSLGAIYPGILCGPNRK